MSTTGTILGDDLYYKLELSAEQPEHFLVLCKHSNLIHLGRQQALAIFRVMLDHLPQMAGNEMNTCNELDEIDTLHRFRRSINWLDSLFSSTRIEPELLQKAYEQHQHAYGLQEEMLGMVKGWEMALELLYDKLDHAAQEVHIILGEVDEDEDEDENQTIA